MSFLFSSPLTTSASTSALSSPSSELETGLTTLEDLNIKSPSAPGEETSASASRPLGQDSVQEADGDWELLQGQFDGERDTDGDEGESGQWAHSDIYTPTTLPRARSRDPSEIGTDATPLAPPGAFSEHYSPTTQPFTPTTQPYSPTVQSPTTPFTPTTQADTVFAWGTSVPGAFTARSASSSSGSSIYSHARGASSSSSGSRSDRTVRTRATAGVSRTRSGAEEEGDADAASTALSPSVVSTLPRIALPEGEALRALLFEPPFLLSEETSPAPPARAHGHRRRRSSGRTRAREDDRWVYKYHESGVSRDFLLIVALCTGLACMLILLGRPAMMSLMEQRDAAGWDID